MRKLGLNSDSESSIQRSLPYTMLPFLPEWKKKKNFFLQSMLISELMRFFILVQVNPSLSKYLIRETYSDSSNNLELMCMNVCVCVFSSCFIPFIQELFFLLICYSGLTSQFCLLCFRVSLILLLSNVWMYFSTFITFWR